jgi:hypothetical protein
MKPWISSLLLALFMVTGCEQTTAPAAETMQTAPAAPTEGELQKPPSPPLHEDFEAAPRLSLFPRIGDFRPAEEETERLAYWKTFLLHLTKTSGLHEIPSPQQQAGRVFALRSVAGLDSLGFFTPLEVLPQRSYQVSLQIKTELPENGIFGIGILEFDRFLWVGEQYTQALVQEHQTGVQKGLELRGQHPWQKHQFRFTTGPETGMVHLVFFREGAADRRPVLMDDIRIELLPR